jgi:hypothetical protein
MTMHTLSLIRAAIALQVAALEWDDGRFDDEVVLAAADKAMEEAAKALKAMKRKGSR